VRLHRCERPSRAMTVHVTSSSASWTQQARKCRTR
jgi:hypothetical protein